MGLLQCLQHHLQMEISMWTQLHSNNHAPIRLSNDEGSVILMEGERESKVKLGLDSAVLRDILGSNPRRNLILGALSEQNFAMILPNLEVVSLASGQVIYQGGDALHHVYFPTTCTASLLSTTVEGETAELALTGRHGIIGVPLVLGAVSMAHSVQIQSSGQACRMSAAHFLHALQVSEQLNQLALSYVQSLMTQMAQSIVCSRHHSVSERLSQWMLLNADGLEANELSVTHETIGHMLGVRRESVTQAAGKLQAAGAIRNSRGKILIQNRERLLQSVCECYARVKLDTAQYAKRLAQLSDSVTRSKTQYVVAVQPSQPEPVQGADLQKYVDAYDFAPVGFATLDMNGHVMQTNLSGAIMMDIQRSQCQHTPFIDFLDEKSKMPFLIFHAEVLRGQCRRFCVVDLTPTAHRAAMTLRIDATSDESGEENRMVMIDWGVVSGRPLEAPVPLPVPEKTMASAWRFQTVDSVHSGVYGR
jgi:CRP-like cAMP-binding protein